MEHLVCIAVGAVVAIISWFAAVTYRKKVVESKIGGAEAQAREIIDEAVKTAEATKKEALLEVKEESLKTKNELEKETKERRAELQKYEKRVLSKEEAVDKKADMLEKKEGALVDEIHETLTKHKRYIARYGTDMPEVADWQWKQCK